MNGTISCCLVIFNTIAISLYTIYYNTCFKISNPLECIIVQSPIRVHKQSEKYSTTINRSPRDELILNFFHVIVEIFSGVEKLMGLNDQTFSDELLFNELADYQFLSLLWFHFITL